MIPKPLDTEERASMVTLLKLGWFLVVTAGKTILGSPSVHKNILNEAEQLSKPLDDFLKDL